MLVEQIDQWAEGPCGGGITGAAMQAWTGNRHVAERCAEPDHRLAFAAKGSAARAAVAMFGSVGPGLRADEPFLHAAQQVFGLVEGQSDLFQPVMGLVEDEHLLVECLAVPCIDPQPYFDLHGPLLSRFSRIGREENL